MNHQEIFNHVWNHFVVEKNPFGWDGEHCCYRTYEGNSCAVGCLLTDEEVETIGSNGPVFELGGFLPNRLLELEDAMDFLGDLQAAHDSVASGTSYEGFPTSSIEDGLKEVAITWGLEIPV